MSNEKDEKYLNPFSDFGFKKLFGEEANKDLLINFLNSLLSLKYKIVELNFRKNEQLGNTELNRKAIFDLYCQDERGQRFIVELQKAEQKFFKDRTIYYSTFPIQEQAIKGEWNYKLDPVYCIGILDFVFDEDKNNEKQYLYKVGLSDLKTKKLFYDKLFFIYIAVPKFKKKDNELENDIEKWVYFLKNLTKFKEIPDVLKSEMFMKAFQIAEIANFTAKERDSYQESIKYYNDLKNSIDKSFEDGEIKEKFKIAKNLKDLGIETEKISKATGLTIKEIEDL